MAQFNWNVLLYFLRITFKRIIVLTYMITVLNHDWSNKLHIKYITDIQKQLQILKYIIYVYLTCMNRSLVVPMVLDSYIE